MTVRTRAVVVVAGLMFGYGCAGTTTFTYTETNLKKVQVGDPKERILAIFATKITSEEMTQGMTIRAARKDASGNLIEVGEVLLLNEEDIYKLTPYWFLFENGFSSTEELTPTRQVGRIADASR